MKHWLAGVAIVSLLLATPWVVAQGTPAGDPDDVRNVGSVEQASQEQQALYTKTRQEEAAWLDNKRRAGETVNADDVLIQSGLDALRTADGQSPEAFLGDAHVQDGAEAFVSEAQAMTKAAAKPMARAIEDIIGSEPQIQDILSAAAAGQPPEPAPARYLVAATRAMGENTIQALMDLAKDHPDMVIVFRGVLPGESVQDLMLFLAKLQPPTDADAAYANVQIDPTVFSKWDITVAPTLLRLDEAGEPIAQARGVVNPQWIEDQIERGARGDLGKFGETTEVAEEDLIEVMKRQLADSNAADRSRSMADNFWHSQPSAALPRATADRVRTVDPTVVVVDGIYGPDGTVIAAPGQRLNPFDAIPFTSHVLIFNARDPAQVEWARDQVVRLEGREVIPIMSEIDPDDGWEHFGTLVNTIGRHVYLLQPEMVQRFQLEAVPSLVEGGDRVLVVREFALSADKAPASASSGVGEQGGSR